MSVQSEFQRILGDTTASLRVRGRPELAEALERKAARAGDSLEGRARAVLQGIDEAADAGLEETLDHLEAICGVILGVQGRREAARR